MTAPRTYHTATLLLDGRVLVAGGAEDRTSAELYDPASGKWTATGGMTQGRSDQTATRLPDGTVLVAGGSGTGDSLATAELYDPGTERWTATGSMHTIRSGHTATLLPDGKVLVAGGIDLQRMRLEPVQLAALTTAELYDPATGKWTTTGSMTVGRTGHTATLLPDGRVLVAGGDTDGSTSAELYDPGTSRWTLTGSMTDSRRDHTATLLPDGKVLVTGGFAGSDYAIPPWCEVHGPCSAELYDAAVGRWTATGSLHWDRVGHTATMLLDDTVLVIGNATRVDHELPAERYQPSSGKWTASASPAKTRGLTATLLADGRVLATGDFSNDSRVAELYEPGVRP